MRIAVYKNDQDRTPYLVHKTKNKKGLVLLGLEEYPEIEQDNFNDLEEVELLDKDTDEYKQAKKEIKQNL